jgi:hypothetical protein
VSPPSTTVLLKVTSRIRGASAAGAVGNCEGDTLAEADVGAPAGAPVLIGALVLLGELALVGAAGAGDAVEVDWVDRGATHATIAPSTQRQKHFLSRVTATHFAAQPMLSALQASA